MTVNTPAAAVYAHHAPPAPRDRAASRSRGFTLVEMLVSLTITMIMMGAVVSLFGLITDNVTGSRATIEMADRLRACRNRLQADLQGITVTMIPPRRPENDEGYLEYIEGQYRDCDYVNTNVPTLLGDADDVLIFTTRSRAEPCVGKYSASASGTVESQVAEVMYFAIPNGAILDPTTSTPTRLYTLYRRVLLVEPGLRASASFPTTPNTTYFDLNDISAHVETPPSGTAIVVPNGLGDLTKRENRFAHYATTTSPWGFPFNLNANSSPNFGTFPTAPNAYLVPLSKLRTGDDVLMTNVLAFDVQIFDPNAAIDTLNGVALLPSDPGYLATGVTKGAGYGGYVDAGYNTSNNPPIPFFDSTAARSVVPNGTTTYLNSVVGNLPPTFSGATLNPAPTSPYTTTIYTYDTWSSHYEADGVNQSSHGNPDWASNGLDDDADGIVDNSTELDTQAPYASQLRGIKVMIRAYEPGSQAVREVTVVQDFLPE